MNSEIFNLHCPELNDVINEYGSMSLFLNKDKVDRILASLLKNNKIQNIYFFSDSQEQHRSKNLKVLNLKHLYMIEALMFLDSYTKDDIVVFDLINSPHLNFSNPISSDIARRLEMSYFIDDKNTTSFLESKEDKPMVIFLLEDHARSTVDQIHLFDEQKRNPLKFMAKYKTPIQAYVYKHSPFFDMELIEFYLQKPQDDISRLWYPCQSEARFTQNELRKKAFGIFPGVVDPESVQSEFSSYHDDFWPFIFSQWELKEHLDKNLINKKLWHALWEKANEDGYFNPEVYNTWWFIYKHLAEINVDQQRKVLNFEHYPLWKTMGNTKIWDLAIILKQIPTTRRYNLMGLWSRSEKNMVEPDEINEFVREIPRIYTELTQELKLLLKFDKITSWEKLHDYISDIQSLVDYGINPIESQTGIKYLEKTESSLRCIVPNTPPAIKKLGKVFHNCLFSYTARVQAGEVFVATFFNELDDNLCIAFNYRMSNGQAQLSVIEAKAKDNFAASDEFISEVKQYLIDKISSHHK